MEDKKTLTQAIFGDMNIDTYVEESASDAVSAKDFLAGAMNDEERTRAIDLLAKDFSMQDSLCGEDLPYTPTRREYFAARAMQAVLSNPKLTSGIREQDIWPCCELTAKFAVKMTDAIIAALKESEGV